MRPSTRILRAHKDRLPFNRIHMLKRFNQRHIQQTLIRPPFCVCYCRLKIPIVCFDAVSQPAAFGINVNTIFQNGRFHTSTLICINKLRNPAQFFPMFFSRSACCLMLLAKSGRIDNTSGLIYFNMRTFSRVAGFLHPSHRQADNSPVEYLL